MQLLCGPYYVTVQTTIGNHSADHFTWHLADHCTRPQCGSHCKTRQITLHDQSADHSADRNVWHTADHIMWPHCGPHYVDTVQTTIRNHFGDHITWQCGSHYMKQCGPLYATTVRTTLRDTWWTTVRDHITWHVADHIRDHSADHYTSWKLLIKQITDDTCRGCVLSTISEF